MNNESYAQTRARTATNTPARLLFCGVLWLALCCARTGSAQTAAQWVGMGRAAMISNDIVTANNDFSNAVVASSSSEDANFFYAFSRIAILPFQPPVKGLLDGFGVSATGRNPWNWTADFQRNAFNQIVLPTNSPTESAVVAVLTNTVLPQIVAALGNLSRLTPNYTNTLSAELNRITPAPITYNEDVVLYQSALQGAEAAILTLGSYNLNFNISSLVTIGELDAFENGSFTVNNFLALYPLFLTLAPGAASSLPSASTALNAAISSFSDGAEAAYADTGREIGRPLFVQRLLEVQDALYGPDPLTTGPQEWTSLDLTKFFSATPVNLRALLPQVSSAPGTNWTWILGGTFPDPTFGGILPDATQDFWIEHVGLVGLADGIPGWWRNEYFFIPKYTDSTTCATCDFDGTSQNNLFKYVAGLDPTNPASIFVLKVTPVTGQPGQKNVSFSPLTTGRVYTVQSSSNLVSGVFSNLTTATPPTTNNLQVTVTDTNASARTRFYRVQVTGP